MIVIKWNYWGEGNIGFQISDFTFEQLFNIPFIFYATTLINHKKVWTQWKIRTNQHLTTICVKEPFRAMKSKIKIKNGGQRCEI